MTLFQDEVARLVNGDIARDVDPNPQVLGNIANTDGNQFGIGIWIIVPVSKARGVQAGQGTH